MATEGATTLVNKLALDPELFHAVNIHSLLSRVQEENDLITSLRDASPLNSAAEGQHTLAHIVLQLANSHFARN